MATYIGSWYDLARAEGFEEEQVPENSIVLIKACDKAESWEHATFRSGKKGSSITFAANAAIPGALASVVAELSGSYTTTRDISPELRKSTYLTPPSGPPTFDLDPANHAYTLFVRFYRIAYRKSISDRFRRTRTIEISDRNMTSSHSTSKVRTHYIIKSV
jgi:hypothetical protein